MPKTDELGAAGLCRLVLDELAHFGLDPARMLSQCYDGCSTMSGDKGGLQRLIQNQQGRCIPYVHCYNHRLDLVVINVVSSVRELGIFFEHRGAICKFFKKFDVSGVYAGTSLKRVPDTRWSGHYDATVAIIENYGGVIEALETVVDSQKFDGEDRVVQTGQLTILKGCQFAFRAAIMKNFLGILKPADSFDQSRENGINGAMILIDGGIKLLADARSEEQFDIWDNAMMCINNNITAEDAGITTKRFRTAPRRLDDYIITECETPTNRGDPKSESRRLYCNGRNQAAFQ
ncbi:hypothetical protein SNE40_011757 [Patella caerulea]